MSKEVTFQRSNFGLNTDSNEFKYGFSLRTNDQNKFFSTTSQTPTSNRVKNNVDENNQTTSFKQSDTYKMNSPSIKDPSFSQSIHKDLRMSLIEPECGDWTNRYSVLDQLKTNRSLNIDKSKRLIKDNEMGLTKTIQFLREKLDWQRRAFENIDHKTRIGWNATEILELTQNRTILEEGSHSKRQYDEILTNDKLKRNLLSDQKPLVSPLNFKNKEFSGYNNVSNYDSVEGIRLQLENDNNTLDQLSEKLETLFNKIKTQS